MLRSRREASEDIGCRYLELWWQRGVMRRSRVGLDEFEHANHQRTSAGFIITENVTRSPHCHCDDFENGRDVFPNFADDSLP